jgi:hypothetical protein
MVVVFPTSVIVADSNNRLMTDHRLTGDEIEIERNSRTGTGPGPTRRGKGIGRGGVGCNRGRAG